MANLIDYNVQYFYNVKAAIEKYIVGKSEELSRGTCETLAEYKAVSGQIEGLRQAMYIMEQVSDEMKLED